jgi:hypothetical protein
MAFRPKKKPIIRESKINKTLINSNLKNKLEKPKTFNVVKLIE